MTEKNDGMAETSETDPIAHLSAKELAQLAEANSPLHRILDALPFIIRIRSVQGRVQFRNKAAALFDSTSNNLRHLLEMADWGGSLPKNEPQSWVQPWLAPDQSILHYSCKRIPVHDEKGVLFCHIEYALDISEEQNARLSRNALERRFDILVEKSIAGVYIIQNNRFIYCNKKLAAMHGFASDEIKRLASIEELVGETDRPRVIQLLSHQLQENIPHTQFRFFGKKKDGTLIRLETAAGIIQLNGQSALLGTVLDITSQTELEGRLQFTQKMEVSGQIASTIAHDFNNLLTIIKGSASILSLDESLAPSSIKNISQIQEAADKSIKLTQQLLQLGKQRLRSKAPIRLDAVLDKWIQAFSKSLPQTILFSSVVQHLQIDGDEAALERVLFALVTHTSSHLSPSARMDFHLDTAFLGSDSPLVQFGKAAQGHYAIITLSYNDSAAADISFDRFFDPSHAPKKDGIPNLSLSIAYNIVRKHDGWIDVINQIGGETQITVYLPLSYAEKGGSFGGDTTAPQSPGTLPGRAISISDSKPRQILVVEDEEIIRSILEVFLSRLGYTVLQASNADEGLSMWHDNPNRIALILSDIFMPGSMNGADMVKQCLCESPNTRAVLMSGYAPSPDLPQGPNLAFLSKPFSMDQIADIVSKMMT